MKLYERKQFQRRDRNKVSLKCPNFIKKRKKIPDL